MAILESCCFWKNVRKGSFACGFYTLIYFGLSTLMFTFYVREEQEFLLGKRTQPVGESILERGDVTVVTVIFNVLFLFCSVLMVLSSILLIVGLRHNKRQLLLPWIGLMLCDLLIECAHLVHLTLSRRVNFDPIVGFIFTIDFFILCLNLYCLLCVISQYQAYRRAAAEQQEHPAMSPTVIFTAPEKLSKSKRQQLAATKAGNSKRHSHRLLAASPLITSQRPTNFSTITEEEEQHQQQQQQQQQLQQQLNGKETAAANGNGDCGHISEQPTSNSIESDIQLHANIPIITLDPNSLQ
ncbi:uncharacterized protein LOC132792134 [Drosophila nasuta]|uniref:uncharacterized protein LOC132792134 n=1 Tax=Drosophila nasuta TaxID=42062 RepID=UPI00295F0DE2|nr:uncharacterized protein LOC132792134 [Drosophila nasuta]XP_060657365.1 uncharacterized protein LOC132792134 [Drosophila nasuta]